MPIDDDSIVVLTRQLTAEQALAADSIADIIGKVILSAIIPFGIGSAITGVLTDIGLKRYNERVQALLTEMAATISSLAHDIPDQAYYQSEEFQALVYEAIDQQRANRFDKKRTLLANGLARSGTAQFKAEAAKDTFFSIVRTIRLEEVTILRQLSTTNAPDESTGLPQLSKDSAEVELARLEGFGLATSHSGEVSTKELSRVEDQGKLNLKLINALDDATYTYYTISDFGERFLLFLSPSD